jgi:hypothetical protein
MFLTVQSGDRSLGFFVTAHLDESESLASTGLAIADHLRALHRAVLREQLFQIRAGC